jgi:hypothetical protein
MLCTHCVLHARGRYHPDGDESDRVIEIDFTPPFKRISMLDGLEEAGGFKIPLPLESEECRAFLDRVCVEHNVRMLLLLLLLLGLTIVESVH